MILAEMPQCRHQAVLEHFFLVFGKEADFDGYLEKTDLKIVRDTLEI